MTDWLVSGHSGAVEWARRRGIHATYTDHLDVNSVQPGDRVFGTLPVALAAQVCAAGATYHHLTLDLPADKRQQELTADEMEALGARIETFEIKGGPMTQQNYKDADSPGATGKQPGRPYVLRILADDWPLGVFVLAPAIAAVIAVVSLPAFRAKLTGKLTESDWWADNLIQFAVFTVGVSLLVDFVQKRRALRVREKFENWTIQLVGIEGVNPERQKVHWTEAQKFEDSEFEYWKFIKSSVSNICRIKTIDSEAARSSGWLRDEGNDILIDFSAMQEDDIINWQSDLLPDTWEWKEPTGAPSPGKEKVARRKAPQT